MSERRINTEAERWKLIEWLKTVEIGFWFAYRKKTRSTEQNKRFHAMIRDVADQIQWQDVFGRPKRMKVESWKRFFLAMYARGRGEENEVVPNEDGDGFYDLGPPRSSKLSVEEMTDVMELIAAFGAERGVRFKDEPPILQDGRAAA